MMPTDNSRQPHPRPAAARAGAARHLFVVADAAGHQEDLAGRIDRLAARIRAGDEMLAEVKDRLDAVEARVDGTEAGAEVPPDRDTVVPLLSPPRVARVPDRSMAAALAVGAAAALTAGYLVVAGAWRLVASVLAAWAP